jgi:hypothetical protein
MANTAKILEGQTLFDWCLVHTGAVSSLFEVMELNSLESIDVAPGTVLQIPGVLKQNVVDFFEANQITTGIIEEITGGFSSTTVTVELLNSLDELISSHSFSIGSGVQEVAIPDTPITLNGDSFLSVPASVTTDIELRDEAGDLITPLSVVDNVIRVGSSSGLPVLSPGTYVPVNTPGGPFELPFIPSANVTTSDSTIMHETGSFSWDSGAKILIPHNGDFHLNFKMTSDAFNKLIWFGLSYFFVTPELVGSYYYNFDHSWYRENGNANVYSNNQLAHAYSGVDNNTLFGIHRVGNEMRYLIDNTVEFSHGIINTGPIYVDSSIASLESRITNIEIIIP